MRDRKTKMERLVEMAKQEAEKRENEAKNEAKALGAEFWRDKEFILRETMKIYVEAESLGLKLKCLKLMRSFWQRGGEE